VAKCGRHIPCCRLEIFLSFFLSFSLSFFFFFFLFSFLPSISFFLSLFLFFFLRSRTKRGRACCLEWLQRARIYVEGTGGCGATQGVDLCVGSHFCAWCRISHDRGHGVGADWLVYWSGCAEFMELSTVLLLLIMLLLLLLLLCCCCCCCWSLLWMAGNIPSQRCR
jgi:hypothetical protein